MWAAHNLTESLEHQPFLPKEKHEIFFYIFWGHLKGIMSGSKDSKEVPMKVGDFSVLDNEFGNMRERFDQEMKKMEEEMNRFRNELLDRDSNKFFQKSGSMTSTQTTSGPDREDSMLVPGGGLGSHSNWLHGLDSPLVRDKMAAADGAAAGQKELKLRFDVSQYSPEEIVVKTVDNKLLVHAKHEEVSGGNSVFREYNREFLLPSGTDPETIRSSLSKDGVLTVEAPLPQSAITQDTSSPSKN